jgi:predicted kinase
VLIVVNGIPGSGKTTLAGKLAKDLAMPCLHKDSLKELLFDTFGVGDLQWSRDLGAGVADMLFSFTARWTKRRRNLILESAFYHSFAAPYFEALVKRQDVIFCEVFCSLDPEIRRQRIKARTESGERHAGHIDQQYANLEESEEAIAAKYAPIGVGKLFRVDTSSFGEDEYQALLGEMTQFMTMHQKEGMYNA